MTRVRSEPEMVQTAGVVEEMVTGSPADEVAPIRKGAVPRAALLRDKNVIVWVPGVTLKLCGTATAAL